MPDAYFAIISFRYDFSEPQFGKDVCDRIISPMKGSLRKYCNEGHNIMTASDMHEALKVRQVKGCTAAVCELTRTSQEIKVNRIENFSAFHNFSYSKNGLCVSKAYGIGSGRCIPWSQLIVIKQGPTSLIQTEDCGFFPVTPRAISMTKQDLDMDETNGDSSDEEALFSCKEPGCNCEFSSFEKLQDHIHFGQHVKSKESESVYDGLKRAWVSKFSSMTLESKPRVTSEATNSSQQSNNEPLQMGWALQKPRTGGSKFSENVKLYLTERFDFGESTGRKADPSQVAADMRTARADNGTRRFSRDEWLTKRQVQGFFSRLSAARRMKPASTEIADNDLQVLEDEIVCSEEKDRAEMVEDIVSKLGVIHPVTYDGYDLCEHVKSNKLTKFTVPFLKKICSHFEIPYKAKDLKSKKFKI